MSIIRSIFGPSKDEIWAQIAAEYNGQFRNGGFLKKDSVHIMIDDWEILLDHFSRRQGKSSKSYTRIRAPFTNADNLYFKLYKKGFFSGIAKYFGMQDIHIKNEEFDREYILKGNDEFKLTWIFDNTNVKKYLFEIDKIVLEIKENSGQFRSSTYEEGIDELYFERKGIIKDINELRSLFELFAVVLAKITELDSGYQ